MPFTRISLLKGKSPAYLQAISHALDRALVEAFEVPANDVFQQFDQREAGELVFDRHYLGGPRSDDFVLFTVTTGRPRSGTVKAAFYRRLVELLAADPGLRPEDVMIVLSHSNSDDWSFADGEMWQAGAAGAAPRALPKEMTVRRLGTDIRRMPEGTISAPAWAEMLLESDIDGENNAMRVTMEPGVHSNWHTHPRGQLLYALSGVGVAQRAGAAPVELRAGDSVWFAPGEKHWHGAAATSTFCYLSVQSAQDGAMVEWLEPVTP